jgi:multidrug resistance efflux pump
MSACNRACGWQPDHRASLVYGHSLRVEGYFEETKLPAIRVGDPASVYLMGVADEITGHVDSIAGGSRTANVQAMPRSWPM